MKAANRIVISLLCSLVAVSAWGTNLGDLVVVSPPVLVLKKHSTRCVTVHANVPLAIVEPGSVRLYVLEEGESIEAANAGIVPVAVFADRCGDLVAKFDLQILRELARPSEVTFVLAWMEDDHWVSGSDTVTVR